MLVAEKQNKYGYKIKVAYHFPWSYPLWKESKIKAIGSFIFNVSTDSLRAMYNRFWIRILGITIWIEDWDEERVITKQKKMKKYIEIRERWNKNNPGQEYWDR